MKSKTSFRCQFGAQRLLLGVALLTASLATAQNYVKNPDFEEELGPEWTLVYTPVINSALVNGNGSLGGPYDFLVAGRTTMSHKDMVPGAWDGHDGLGNDWSKFGLMFAPNHTWVMHAYFKQVVTNLMPGASYDCSAWIAQTSLQGDHVDAAQVYMEVLGGTTNRTPYVTDSFQNNPPGWKKYTVTMQPSSSGQIELQLHYNKIKSVGNADNNYWEYRNQNACFDHVAVMPAGQTEYMPPYNIVSLARTNQDVTLTWETVMNNRYRIQATTNLSAPISWVMLERERNVDTNLFATGTSFTFTTNVSSLFYYDPPTVKVPIYFDPDGPLFFRISSESYKP